MTLESLTNPSDKKYEIKITTPELTFLGVKSQPDFATLDLTFYPNKKVIELKSFKKYLYSFRDKIISYERLINTIYDDVMNKYEPNRLIIIMKTTPRGGILSELKIDSKWR